MRHIDPATIHHSESHRYLLSCVAPRPIAFAGTVDSEGRPNLAPFSFFNAFGANPPVVAFSPAFRGTDGSPKHTLMNVLATGEFTISVVSYSMVEQISLASCDFPEGVDEFLKAGFTKLPSHKIKPPGVAQSPMVMECKLLHHIPVGNAAGSANILVGEVVMFHLRESIFDGQYPSAERLDLVARMGGPQYCRASGPAVFTLAKPTHNGIGFDALPGRLLESTILTGNDLAKLAGVKQIPDLSAAQAFIATELASLAANVPDDLDSELRVGAPERAFKAFLAGKIGGDHWAGNDTATLHRIIQGFLKKNDVTNAWNCALAEALLPQPEAAPAATNDQH